MKTTGIFVRTMLLLLPLLFVTTSLQAQSEPFTGHWEGKFMGDFKTVIEISSPSPGDYTGTIRMFSGPQMIQDDPLSEIHRSGREVSFLIPAKETLFSGLFQDDFSILSGNFTFPDGSKHPIELKKAPGPENGPLAGLNDGAVNPALAGRLLTPVEMKADLQFLVGSLEKYHPRLYSYTPEASMVRLVDSIQGSLSEPLDLESFFIRIAPVTDAVHCSHTGIRLSSDYRRFVEQHGNFLPLQVLCKPEGLFLVHAPDPLPTGIVAGTRIVSINGHPSGKIIGEMLPLVPSEGNNMTAKWHQMSHRFAWFYHLIDPAEDFQVVFQTTPPGETVSFPACDLEKEELGRGVPDEMVPLSFSISKSGKTGILQVPTFAIMDMDGYMAELEQIFLQLSQQEVPHLILDLRGNAGGHPIFAAQLLTYLVHDEFTYFKPIPGISELEPLYHPMAPDPSAFHGTIFVLVDGGCLSTTGHLISLIRCHTQAVFAGEEPGSTFRCNDFSIQVVLPNSGIEANIPRATFETAVKQGGPATKFTIDHPVSPDPAELASGTDRAMLTCLELTGDH